MTAYPGGGTEPAATVPRRPTIEVVKASFNLPKAELEHLRTLANRRGINVTQALRQAIATEFWLDQQLQDGRHRLMLQGPNGSEREIVFHTYWSTEATSVAGQSRAKSAYAGTAMDESRELPTHATKAV